MQEGGLFKGLFSERSQPVKGFIEHPLPPCWFRDPKDSFSAHIPLFTRQSGQNIRLKDPSNQ